MKHSALLLMSAVAIVLSSCTQAPVLAPVENILLSSERVTEQPEPVVKRPAVHTVSKGETLTSIALNHGLDYRELALWNNLRDPDLIQPGQRLSLTKPESVAEVGTVTKEAKIIIAPVESKPPVKAPDKPAYKSVIIDSGKAAPAALAPADAPLKTAPQALKYIYSAEQLTILQRRWQASIPAAVVSPSVAVAPPTKPAAASSAAAPSAVRRRFDVDWSWPFNREASEKFNEVRKGINFFGKVGEPIYASADGKVVYVGTGVKAYGRLIILKHENDYLTAYAHNDKVFIKEGDVVKKGNQIAELGSTGADKPMLHFEVRKSGKPFDPLQVLPPKLR